MSPVRLDDFNDSWIVLGFFFFSFFNLFENPTE